MTEKTINSGDRRNFAVPVATVLSFERSEPRDESLAWLRERGIEIRFGRAEHDPQFKRYSEDDIIEAARDVDALMGASSANITRRVIEALPRLRYISKRGVGVDTIDVAAATERGIVVTNTPEALGVIAVAEHAIALMLALIKQLTFWTPEFVRKGGWRGGHFATMLDGSTVGIIGYGRIGRAVAQRLAGWNVRVLAYDPYLADPVAGATLVDLPTLLSEAVVVTLHCETSATNHHLIDRHALELMKREAILVNTGRGSLVDTDALRECLKGGGIAGAGLDVFELEPPDPADDLFTLGNVVVTPHVAARTLRVFLDRHWHAARNLWAMVSGEGHADIVNPEVRPRAARETV